MVKTQLGPRVETDIAEAYRDFVTFTNDGSYKGRLGNEVEKALKYHMALYFIRNPQELSQAVHSDDVQKGDFAEDIKQFVDEMANDILHAAQNLDGETVQDQEAASDVVGLSAQEAQLNETHSEKLFSNMDEPHDIDTLLRRIEKLEKKVDEA